MFNSIVEQENLQIKVYDVLGRIVLTHSINIREGYNAISLNISDLPAGEYFINLRDVRHKGITKPFIIIRD